MFGLQKTITKLTDIVLTRDQEIAEMKIKIDNLELHKAWADGEIDFWQEKCKEAEKRLNAIHDICHEEG